MTGSDPEDTVADAFVEQRRRLVAVAYRMLGSQTDAEDAVQEAWLRLARQDAATIDNLAGWLTTVVGRVCIDMLRSRKTRPETPYDDRLPEFVVTEDHAEAPEEDALLADSVGLALLVVLDTLRPDERLAFVLHDMFAVPFGEIGQIIGRSTDAARCLPAGRGGRCRARIARPMNGSSRARWSMRFSRPRGAETSKGCCGCSTRTWRGAPTRRAESSSGWERPRWQPGHSTALTCKVTARRVLVNGEPGIMAWSANGRPRSVMACTVVDGRIVEMLSVTDPERLAAMDLPRSPDAPASSCGIAVTAIGHGLDASSASHQVQIGPRAYASLVIRGRCADRPVHPNEALARAVGAGHDDDQHPRRMRL